MKNVCALHNEIHAKNEVTEVIVLKCKQSVFKCQAQQLSLEEPADGYFSLPKVEVSICNVI